MMTETRARLATRWRTSTVGDLADPVLVGYNIGAIIGATISRQYLMGAIHGGIIAMVLLFRIVRKVYETKLGAAQAARAMAQRMTQEFEKAVAAGPVVFGGEVDTDGTPGGTKH